MGEERKTARLGRATLGGDRPVICVPVMGRTAQEMRQAARRAKDSGADVIELRMDSMRAAPDAQEAADICRAVKEEAGLPLIFTLRTARDGGAGTTDAAAYEALLTALAQSGAADGIDCELSVGEEAFARLARAAQAAGTTLIGSAHSFTPTHDPEAAVRWMMRQEALGADVCKAAVMAATQAEALAQMAAYARAGEALKKPMIAIVMGRHGVLSRIGAQAIGSCLTFGTAGDASAPGQMDAKRLREAIRLMDEAMQ